MVTRIDAKLRQERILERFHSSLPTFRFSSTQLSGA
jgi:hypothetical protein